MLSTVWFIKDYKTMQLKITIAENLGYLILCTELQQPMRAVTFRIVITTLDSETVWNKDFCVKMGKSYRIELKMAKRHDGK